jgi:hypothetical protein
MKRYLIAALLALSMATMPFVLQSCAANTHTVTAPKTPVQTIYVLEQSLIVATNALADLHNAGVVVGANYATAYELEHRAHATLLDAQAAATAKDATKTAVLLRTLSGLIDQIAIYNGGKK